MTVIKKDLTVLETLVKNNVEPTDSVINAIWRWFIDVELILPLPIMEFSEEERTKYALEIIEDLQKHFSILETKFSVMNDEEQKELSRSEDAQIVNSLWRELAGMYATVINGEVAVLDEDEQEAAHAHAVEMLSHSSGMDEEEIRDRIKYDPTMRLMLRKSGLDPDRIR
jgi:hypothetical protein